MAIIVSAVYSYFKIPKKILEWMEKWSEQHGFYFNKKWDEDSIPRHHPALIAFAKAFRKLELTVIDIDSNKYVAVPSDMGDRIFEEPDLKDATESFDLKDRDNA